MANYENDVLMMRKEKNGNTHVDYPITKYDNVLDAPVVYQVLTDIASNITESTSLLDIFNAMATPSRLACNISNGSTSVYPASSGTLTINKTGNDTGNAMFMDIYGRVSTAVFTPGGGISEWYHLTEHTDSMCNDNILINTDFTHPVNQHGQSEYTGYGYTIDMWQSEGPTVKIEDGCIAISGEGSVVQKTELYLIKSLLGKTVTLSIMTDDYMIHTVTFDMPKTIGTNTFASPGIYFDGVTAQIVLFWDQQVYQTCRFTLGPDATIRLKKIKLELGTVSTLKNEVVNYAEQLRKCQRYYLRILPTRVTTAFAYDTTTACSIFDIEEMRISPSLAGYDGIVILTKNGWKTCTEVKVFGVSKQRIAIDFITSDLTPGESMIIGIIENGYIEFSAEL